MAASDHVTGRSALERALDKALAVPASRIEERIARMRRDRPGADAAELVELAASRFRTEAALSSGAVGASAALPAVGTGTATALTIGQTAVFLASAVTYVLTVAELQGLRVVDTDKRRALVISALLGREGSEAVQGSLGVTTLFWAAQYLAQRLLAAAPRGRYLAVFGLLADKDLDGVLEPLTGLVQDWAVAPLPTPRSRPAAELEAALILRQVPASSHADIAAALDAQCAKATADDVILLFGSFYSVAEGLEWLARRTDKGE